MAGNNRGIGSLFCNDEDGCSEDEEQLVNGYYSNNVLEKSGNKHFNVQDDEPAGEMNFIDEKTKKQEIQKGSKNKDEIKKFKYNKTAKLSQEEAEQLECVKDAFGYSTDSEAIRWFILKAWEIYGVDVEKTAKKIRKIRAQQ